MTAFFFLFRKFLAWFLLGLAIMIVFAGILKVSPGIVAFVVAILMVFIMESIWTQTPLL